MPSKQLTFSKQPKLLDAKGKGRFFYEKRWSTNAYPTGRSISSFIRKRKKKDLTFAAHMRRRAPVFASKLVLLLALSVLLLPTPSACRRKKSTKPKPCPSKPLGSAGTQGGVVVVSPGGVGSSSFFGDLGRLGFAANDCRNGDQMKHGRPVTTLPSIGFCFFFLVPSVNTSAAPGH